MPTILESPHKWLLLASTLCYFCDNTALADPLFLRPDHNLYQGYGHVFDYVVVGSGPGGLVTANRLTEDPNISVAVVEAGTYAEHVIGNLSEVPAYNLVFEIKAVNSTPSGVDWGFLTTPQPGMNGQVVRYPRGKALGGCTNLNDMAWAEASRGAFRKWADEVGDESYVYENVKKYYSKAMNFTPPPDTRFANTTPEYNPALVTKGGPMAVTYPAYAYSYTTWVAVAMEGIGIPNTESFVNGALNGSAWHMSTVNHTDGFRVSADRAYLRPFLSRPNLAIFSGTIAQRIIFNGNKTATGVEVTTGNATYTLNASREVIVSGGVFQSPQLLQVSGIGPAALLREHNIPVIADRPGVGQNLNDQFLFGVTYQINLATSTTLSRQPFIEEEIVLFDTNATGRLTNPGGEYAGYEKVPQYLRSNFSQLTLDALATFPEDWPDIEYLALPDSAGNLGSSPNPTNNFDYGTLFGVPMVATSRGNVSITSAEMSDPPLINPNYLSTQSDVEVAIAIFKRLRQAWAVHALAANLTIGNEFYPGESVQSDSDIEQFIRNTLTPLCHASATCKMGKVDDDLAVVDPHGKVYGVHNLRVVDASIFPFLIPGPAPQAAVYMLAEKIAEDIKNGN